MPRKKQTTDNSLPPETSPLANNPASGPNSNSDHAEKSTTKRGRKPADKTTEKTTEKKSTTKKSSADKGTVSADSGNGHLKTTAKAPSKRGQKKSALVDSTSSSNHDEALPTKKTGKSLLIVESPTKVKTIGKYLGSNYTVLATYGHVRDLPKGRKSKAEEVCGITIAGEWIPRYVIMDRNDKMGQRASKARRTTQDILEEIRQGAAHADQIYLATDPDREGEAIAWHLSEALKLHPAKTFRITFNEITKSAIQNALKHPQHINMNRVAAQEARRMLDRVVGFPLSGYLRDALHLQQIGAGRVQSVAVKLIVDRELEIEAFKPEEYWRIIALLSPEGTVTFKRNPKNAKVYAKKQSGKLESDDPGQNPDDKLIVSKDQENDLESESDSTSLKSSEKKLPEGSFHAELVRWETKEFRPISEAEVDPIYAILDRAQYIIKKIEESERKERPQAPFTTSTMQQTANRRLRMTTKNTMRVAQELYQGVSLGSDGSVGLITYMRTDSTRISNDAMNMVRGHIQNAYGQAYLPASPNNYSSGKSAQEAHEAIRPTDLNYTPQKVQGFLSREQFRLYELIYNRFVASQMNPAIFAVTQVEIEAAAGLFKATGRVEKFDGYRKVMPVESQGDTVLPKLQQNQKLDRLDLTASQHFTQPPSRFNEASLVKSLEKEGIGRPSTYANIIARIQEHGHVRLENRRFFATEIGKRATELLNKGFPNVLDVKFTSHIEEELDEIENGNILSNQVLNEFWNPFVDSLKKAKENIDHKTGELCPVCSKPLIERWSKKSGKPFVGCSGWKKDGSGCDYVKPGEGEPERPKAQVTDFICPACGQQMMLKTNRFGKPFLSCSGYKTDGSGCHTIMNIGEDGKPVVSVIATKHPCPKCNKVLLLRQGKNGPFLSCSDTKCKTTVDCDPQGNPVKKADTGLSCEKCGSPMVIRKSWRGPFLSCSGYPNCKNAKSITADLREKLKDQIDAIMAGSKKSTPTIEVTELCPECDGPMKVRNAFGRYFLGCTNYPKCKGTRQITAEITDKINAAKAAAAS